MTSKTNTHPMSPFLIKIRTKIPTDFRHTYFTSYIILIANISYYIHTYFSA